MKKAILKGDVAALLGVGLLAGNANALLMEVSGGYWGATDETSGDDGSFSAFMDFSTGIQNAAFVGAFGVYEVDDIDAIAPTVVQDMEIFSSATATVGGSGQVGITEAGSDFVLTGVDNDGNLTGLSITIDENVFGFYIDYDVDGDGTFERYFTDSRLNIPAGTQNVISFALTGVGTPKGIFSLDAPAAGDVEFPDLVTVVDVAPVPEPATMLLFGAGLVGLAGVARRKK